MDPTTQAFAGSVTEVGDGVVALTVDNWYTDPGGPADFVIIASGTDVPVSLDGIDFVDGGATSCRHSTARC